MSAFVQLAGVFLPVWWLTSKRQEVAAASLSLGCGYSHSVDFHGAHSVRWSRSPDSKRGDRDLTFPGGYVDHLGAL